MKLAYVDSSVWITYVEGFTSYQQQIDEKLEQLAAEGWLFCTSDVVKIVCHAKPPTVRTL